MATVDEVLAAIKHVTQCTGDPVAWRTGLSREQLADAATMFAVGPQRLDMLLSAIRQHHPDLFGGPAERQEGDTADAIRDAEMGLAQQGSATAQLDLQVVAAILNAHQKNVAGAAALDQLRHDIETAVRTRTDLDTPAGAHDFERFLIGKLQDIRGVLVAADLDDTSKSALMAAWTALYRAAKDGPADDADRDRQAPRAAIDSLPTASGPVPAESADDGTDPYLDAFCSDDPGMATGVPSQEGPSAPATSSLPALPNLGGGAAPAPAPSWGSPGGFALPGWTAGSGMQQQPGRSDDADLESDGATDRPSADATGDDEAGEPAPARQPPDGPTTVTLPNGETVTAASPQLAAVITAAVHGTPIAEAFDQQGITIPPPGTAVADPVDPRELEPGDIGMFTTRHALALGHGDALVDGQIQHISAVAGPSFLGWEHPPVPATDGAPAESAPPAPTRPAAAAAAQ